MSSEYLKEMYPGNLSNNYDRKWVRFSKEKMILGVFKK